MASVTRCPRSPRFRSWLRPQRLWKRRRRPPSPPPHWAVHHPFDGHRCRFSGLSHRPVPQRRAPSWPRSRWARGTPMPIPSSSARLLIRRPVRRQARISRRVASSRLRRNCVPFAATQPPVSITECEPARAARDSSSGPSRRVPNTSAWRTRTARWTRGAAIAVSSVGSKSVWLWAWSRKWCARIR